MKKRFLISVFLVLAFLLGITGVQNGTVFAATPLKIIGYLGSSVSGVNLSQLSGGIWEVFTPNSPTDMTLVPAAGSPSGIPAMVKAGHSAGIPIEVSVYAPWGSPDYNGVFTNWTLRQALFRQIVSLVNQYGFDGVNFDWECDNQGTNPADITNFYAELYAILNPLGKTISATENYGSVVMTPAAANYLQYIGIMVYDCGQPVTWFGTLDDVVSEMTRWANAGFPKAKLLAGTTFAVRTTQDTGWYSYRMIVDTYNPSPAQNQVAGYAYNGSDLVTQKAQFVKNNGFGGVFTYATELDKFGDPRSLLQHVRDTFGTAASTSAPQTQYGVTISVLGQGTTSPAAGVMSVNAGSTVSVTATPASGYTFSRWTGSVSSTANPLSIPVNSNMTLQAVFTRTQYGVTISTLGQGTTSPAAGVMSVNAGSTISVTATPASGYSFSRWTGSVSSTANPLSIPVNSNMTLQAVFTQTAVVPPPVSTTYRLDVSVVGQGATSLPLGGSNIPANQIVTLTAIPAPGWKFRSWSWPGNDPGYSGWTDNPVSWKMVESLQIVAIFDPIR